MKKKILGTMQALLMLTVVASVAPSSAKAQTSTASSIVILNRDQAAAFLPPSVFFRGQSATVQARNSAGLRLPNSKLVLTSLVDTSGYSSALQQVYQAYLITEVPLRIDNHILHPGAYGFGFLAGNNMTVMDLGGNELFRATTARDESLSRPNPLQILADGNAFRLYLGRSYIAIAPF